MVLSLESPVEIIDRSCASGYIPCWGFDHHKTKDKDGTVDSVNLATTFVDTMKE